jgi:hypothetical protein
MCMRTGNIGPWLIWAYWINPLTYALKALTVSEFSAPRWQKPTPGNPSVPLGTAVLQANDLSTNTWWIGAAIGILIAYIIIGNIVLNVALRLLNGGPNLFGCRDAFAKSFVWEHGPLHVDSSRVQGVSHHLGTVNKLLLCLSLWCAEGGRSC